jgi:hypothetical protein
VVFFAIMSISQALGHQIMGWITEYRSRIEVVLVQFEMLFWKLSSGNPDSHNQSQFPGQFQSEACVITTFRGVLFRGWSYELAD